MTQKQDNKNTIFSTLGDFAYIIAAVAIIGSTYAMVSNITPSAYSRNATSGQQVLGESTSRDSILYLSSGEENLPYIEDFSISGNTSLSGISTVKIHFTSLEASNYTFRAITLKNTNTESATIRVTPNFSLEGGYAPISLTYAGMTQNIIDTKGLVTPLDITISGNTVADISITIQPTTKLATPTSLSLNFTEVN